MKLALTKFKHYPSLSEETTAYEAVITVDGVPADQGREALAHWLNQKGILFPDHLSHLPA